MLSDFSAYPILTSDDLERAKDFYINKLGLKEKTAMQGVLMLEAGEDSLILIYEKKGAQRPDNTVLGFDVKDIEELVEELKGKGVVFEDYDLPGIKTVNSIADMGGVKTAWFKDSEGNVIALNQMG